MNVEVIIACRGEMPVNLARTLDSLRGVPVRVIMDGAEVGNTTLPQYKTAAVPWNIPLGCGAARHYGIITSTADLIVLCDGHMIFEADTIPAIVKHHAKRRNHLTCCRMQSHNQDGSPMDCGLEGGAWLCLKSREVCGEYWALSAKWNSPPAVRGPVGAVMGACYAFRREWYDKIGQPLRILRAWGGDEEILSLATHLMGGKVHLLPNVVGHIYMAAHRGRVQTADEVARRWGNRYAILHALPMPYMERMELESYMRQTRRIVNDIPLPPMESNDLRGVLEKGPVTWAQLKERGIVRNPTDEEQSWFLGSSRMRDDDRRAVIAPIALPSTNRTISPRTNQRFDEWRSFDAARRAR